MLLNGCIAFPGRSAVVPADPVLGVKWLTQAAAQRDAQSMTALGQCYEKGRGVPASHVQAFKWYFLAAERNDILGGIYRNQLVPKLTPDQVREGEQLVAAARGGVESVPSARLVGIGLKGISGSPQRRLALINNVTFADGESGNIKVGGQSVLITCHDIGEDTVIISVAGDLGMARLKLGAAAEAIVSPGQGDTVQAGSSILQSLRNAPVPMAAINSHLSPPPNKAYRQIENSSGGVGIAEPADAARFSVVLLAIAGGGFILAVVIVLRFLARRNKRDAESLQKLFGYDRVGRAENASENARPKADPLREWFQQRTGSASAPPTVVPGPVGSIPADPVSAVQTRSPVTDANLIQRIGNLDWFQFEKIIGVIYGQLGYAVSRRGGANPDGGIDLIIARDGESIAVQCKHWKAWEIKVRTVREFLGALTDSNISKGFIVTLAGHTGDARNLADKHGIVFVNETSLRDMLRQIGATANSEVLDILDDTRKFCPKCEALMTLRTSGSGRGAGAQFWGCSTYPKCKFTMPLEQVAA